MSPLLSTRQTNYYVNFDIISNDQTDNISIRYLIIVLRFNHLIITLNNSEFHFDSDIQYPFPVDRSQEMPPHKQALITEETVDTKESKKKVNRRPPSTDSNAISLIPRSWELFEGKGIQNLCQDLNIKSKEDKKKNNDSLNILSSVDIDDSFEVDDFL